MDINEVKKLVYKQNPRANMYNISKEGILYSAEIDEKVITFLIPLSDIDANFFPEMDAKLLLRWLQID